MLVEFSDHDGFSGLVIGAMGESAQLEFVVHAEHPAQTEPSEIVFYFDDATSLELVVERLTEADHRPFDNINPYWAAQGAVSFLDPGGWTVVLHPPAD